MLTKMLCFSTPIEFIAVSMELGISWLNSFQHKVSSWNFFSLSDSSLFHSQLAEKSVLTMELKRSETSEGGVYALVFLRNPRDCIETLKDSICLGSVS